jgi:subtilisin family serine protease
VTSTRRALLAVAAGTMAATPSVAIAQADEEKPVEQYVVAVEGPAALGEVRAELVADGAMVTNTITGAIPGLSVTMDEATARSLEVRDGVVAVEPDAEIQLFDTQHGAPWNLDRLDQRNLPLDSTYTPPTTGVGVTAYVIDSGVRSSHAEFGGRASRGWSWDGGVPSDCIGHGTHIAATLGGATWGVAKGVTIVPVKVSGCSTSTVISVFLEAANWVVADHPSGAPAVVNLSLGTSASAIVDAAVASMVADGITVVVAAGNDAQPTCSFSPARAPAAITVAASTVIDGTAAFTNHGSCNDLFAPGVDIRSASHLSDIGSLVATGTSMAAPHVAGAAALILQSHPSASPSAVWAMMSAAATRGLLAECCGDPDVLLNVGQGVAPLPPPTSAPGPPLPVGDGPGAVSTVRGEVHAFARGQDDALYVRHMSVGGWSEWAGLGGVVTSAPGAATRTPGQLDVFARGQDGALWGRTSDGASWGPWVGLGGILIGAPAVVSRSPGTLDVFVAGVDRALYHRHFDGSSWGGWNNLGGILVAPPAVASAAPGVLDVFVRGQDDALWVRSFDGAAWGGWAGLGGILTTGPGATSGSQGTYDVFARGQDNALWRRSRDGGGLWDTWTTLGGAITSPPAAVSADTGSVTVFARGVDDAMWVNHDGGGGARSWSSLGGVLR